MQMNKYWFAAKKYGWGWGLPMCWQGWLVYSVYLVLLVTLSVVFHPATQLALFMMTAATLSLLLVAICWLKGEPPRWRWGK